MNTFNIFIISRIGGSRGNSSRGVNFGSVGNPNPQTIELPSGKTITTDIQFRNGSLLSYAVSQAYIKDATISDIFHIFFNKGYEIFTDVDMSDPQWVRDSKGEQIVPSTKGGQRFDEEAFWFDTFKREWRLSFFRYMTHKLGTGFSPYEILFVGLNKEPCFGDMTYGEEGYNFRRKYIKDVGYEDKHIYVLDYYPDNLARMSYEEIWGY